jgi:hypothetical protein
VQEKPVLYVDVDGVISLWGWAPDERPAGAFTVVDGIPHFLSSAAGGHLLALTDTYELVWCTGWEEKANEHLLPTLGVSTPLDWLRFDALGANGHTTPGHWKLEALEAHAGSRAIAWIDDAFNEACFAWASARPAPTLLVETDPAVGMVDEHAAQLRAWAASLA